MEDADDENRPLFFCNRRMRPKIYIRGNKRKFIGFGLRNQANTELLESFY